MKQALSKYFYNGTLTKEEKILLMVGIFAARRKENEMLKIVEIAIENDIPVEKMAELISSAIISRGIPTWLSGIEAITLALSKVNKQEITPYQKDAKTFKSKEECIQYYQSEFDVLPRWVEYLIHYAPDILLTYSNIRNVSLSDGHVTRLLKELLLYAINVCDAYPKGIELHQANAERLGADDEMLNEVKELCILAVGMKAIFS